MIYLSKFIVSNKKKKNEKIIRVQYYYLPYDVNVVLKCGIISSSNNDEVKTTYYLVYDST